MRATVERPALVLSWVEKIENRLVDRAIGGRLRGGVGSEVAGDAQFASPRCRDVSHDQGDHDDRPEHDDQGETAASPRHPAPGPPPAHHPKTGSGSVSRAKACCSAAGAPDPR